MREYEVAGPVLDGYRWHYAKRTGGDYIGSSPSHGLILWVWTDTDQPGNILPQFLNLKIRQWFKRKKSGGQNIGPSRF